MQSQALTLRAVQIKENDRLITALTKEQGIVRAFANGARKPKNPLHGATQPFAFGQLEFAARRDTYIVKEATAQGLFFDGLAADITRLALANYFAALCIELCPQEEPAPTQLKLVLNALHFLSLGTRPQALLKAVVELQLLCLAGYMPDVDNPGEYFAETPLPVQQAVRFICDAPPQRVFRFALPQEGLQALAWHTGHYLSQQTNKVFEELAYYQKMCYNNAEF